jgi:O-6-methylguanine DNA methyltransferase
MFYYSIFQNDIAPFIYIFDDSQQKLLESNWLISKKNILLIKKNAFYKKWPLLDMQLEKYFQHELRQFKIKLDFNYHRLNSFSQNVGQIILEIPYGETLTYQNIAQKLNKPKACRAIGQACRINPFPIIIPCHRVIGKKGLGGYAGKNYQSINLEIKLKLLQLESEGLKN